jgi:hypothetical protein
MVKMNLGLIDMGKCMAYSEEFVLFIYTLYGRILWAGHNILYADRLLGDLLSTQI